MAEITPHVFISAASGDLRSARDIVKDNLLTIGCHPIVQEHFEPDFRTVYGMLRARVEKCHAVIHLVGFHYGGEPDPGSLPEETPQRSWTQLEHDIARELGLKTYLFVFGEGYPFDQPSFPDPGDELQRQLDHRNRILEGDYLYTLISSPEELATRVLELRLKAEELKKQLVENQEEFNRTIEGVRLSAGELKSSQAELRSQVEDLSGSFAELSQSGGLISAPVSAVQYYANARLCETRGEYLKARGYYIGYFQFELEFLDPYLRFVQYLKVEEGVEGAKESFRLATAKISGGIAAKIAASTMWEREQRMRILEECIAADPDCAPAYYFLGLDFSEKTLGRRSRKEEDQERQLLEKFQDLDNRGEFVPWFLDRSFVTEWRSDAASRLQKLVGQPSIVPLAISWMSHNTGWIGTIQVTELATGILWRKKGENLAPVSTGYLPSIHPSTGKPLPNPSIQLPKVEEPLELEIFYLDINGEQIGPFEERFEPARQSIAHGKAILDMTRTSWVGFREYDGRLLLYFTHVLSHRECLSAIRYGLDTGSPESEFPLGDDSLIYLEVPLDTSYVTVQLCFTDGEHSTVERFERSSAAI